MFPRITQYAHQLLQSRIKVGDWVIDATMGNGHDTLFLAQLVGEVGKVYAFDIQTKALHNTNQLLENHNLRHRVELFQQSHDRLHFPSDSIAAVVFNLGYLPGSDKAIATMPETTLKAIENSLGLLKVGGLVVLTIYWGHEQGQLEKEAVEKYVEGLSYPEYMVLRYQYVNPKNNPPFILAIERRK